MFSYRLVYIKKLDYKKNTFYQIQDFGISLSRNDARYQIDNNAPTYRGSDKPANAMHGWDRLAWHRGRNTFRYCQTIFLYNIKNLNTVTFLPEKFCQQGSCLAFRILALTTGSCAFSQPEREKVKYRLSTTIFCAHYCFIIFFHIVSSYKKLLSLSPVNNLHND